jgi:hypothetical protein
MNKTWVIGAAFLLAILGFIVYSSLNLARYRVEVCIDFNGLSNCRTASADTREHALRSAVNNACAGMVSGVTETMACERTDPKSIRWLSKK